MYFWKKKGNCPVTIIYIYLTLVDVVEQYLLYSTYKYASPKPLCFFHGAYKKYFF